MYFTDEPKTWGRYAKRVRENSLVCCASVAICDLSSRNPNVLFELGLRQAFDVPVLLCKKKAPLRHSTSTHGELPIAGSRFVILTWLKIEKKSSEGFRKLKSMHNSGEAINSIVRLLSLVKAPSLSERMEADQNPLLQIILAEMNEFRKRHNGKHSGQVARAASKARAS